MEAFHERQAKPCRLIESNSNRYSTIRCIVAECKNDPEGLAEYFLDFFFSDQDISFPINPFGILEKLGVSFVLRNLEKLEGVLIADGQTPDSVLIAINAKRAWRA